MFSRAVLKAVFMFVFAVQFAACDSFLRGKRSQPPEPVKIELQEAKCMSDFPKVLEKFLLDQSSFAEYSSAWSCLRKSLNRFTQITKGQKESSYTAQEVQHFFNRYWLKENPISDPLMEQLMKIKTLIVGGSVEELTRIEITRINEFTEFFEKETFKLHGHMQLILFAGKNISADSIQNAQNLVRRVLLNLLRKSKAPRSFYEFRDLKVLSEELKNFMRGTHALDNYIHWFNFVESLKNLFMGQYARLMSLQDWEHAADWATRAFFTTLEYYYLVSTSDMNKSENWPSMMTWATRLFEVIEASPILKERGHLPAESIDKVIDAVYGLGVRPLGVSADLLKDTYRKMLFHFVEGRSRGQGNALEIIGFGQHHLRLLRTEFEIWKFTQSFLVSSYREGEPAAKNFRTLLTEANSYADHRALSSKEKSLGLQREILLSSWRDWKAMLQARFPLLWRPDKKLHIEPNYQTLNVDFVGMSMLNAMRTLSRVVMRGYGNHESIHLFENSISLRRFENFEEDFRDFGRAIGLLDPRNIGAARRTFREANFFTFSGNGDDTLDASELLEVLSSLFSGGRFIADQVHQDLVKIGCGIGRYDVFGREIITETCFRSLVRNNLSRYMPNLPGMMRYINSLQTPEFSQFYEQLLLVARLDDYNEAYVEYAELRTATAALQYIESLLSVYDADHNGLLTQAEILNSVPRFRSFVAEISPLGNTMVEDIFLYLLYKGKKPGGLTDLAKFKADRVFRPLGSIGRGHILAVMGLLKRESAGVQTQPAE